MTYDGLFNLYLRHLQYIEIHSFIHSVLYSFHFKYMTLASQLKSKEYKIKAYKNFKNHITELAAKVQRQSTTFKIAIALILLHIQISKADDKTISLRLYENSVGSGPI